MASVRRATPADLPQLLEMGRAMHAESPQYRGEPFEDDVARAWLADRMATNLLADDNALFVADCGDRLGGMLSAIMAPRYFNRLRIAAELLLYVRPEHRGGRAFPRLVEAYRAWAKAQGAHRAYLGVSTGIHPERTVHAYERLGGTLDGYNVSFDL